MTDIFPKKLSQSPPEKSSLRSASDFEQTSMINFETTSFLFDLHQLLTQQQAAREKRSQVVAYRKLRLARPCQRLKPRPRPLGPRGLTRAGLPWAEARWAAATVLIK